MEFALRSAGVRSVKVARVLLDEQDEDVAALVESEPWLFAGLVPATSQNASQTYGFSTGKTGLELAGVADGDDGRDLKRWERIAGLTNEREG